MMKIKNIFSLDLRAGISQKKESKKKKRKQIDCKIQQTFLKKKVHYVGRAEIEKFFDQLQFAILITNSQEKELEKV